MKNGDYRGSACIFWKVQTTGFCVDNKRLNGKKYHPECTKTHRIWGPKAKNFLGMGHSPLPRPYLLGAFGASILAPAAQTSSPTASRLPRASSVFEPCRRPCKVQLTIGYNFFEVGFKNLHLNCIVGGNSSESSRVLFTAFKFNSWISWILAVCADYCRSSLLYIINRI